MITDFGKEVRKHRIDKSLSLRDMADDLGVSASYLSSVETGKRRLSDELVDQIIGYLRLTKDEAHSMKVKAATHQQELVVSLKGATPKQVESAVCFARSLNGLTDEDLDQITSMIIGKV